MKHYITFCELLNEVPLTLLKKNRGVCIYGCFLKWWYPHFTPQNGKPMGLLGKPTILGNPHIATEMAPYSISTEAALKPYAEKTSAGDLYVIDGPCIGASALLTSEDYPPGNGYISHQNGKFGKSSSSKVIFENGILC